jgi:ABC-type Fe3+ transport system permease subunit
MTRTLAVLATAALLAGASSAIGAPSVADQLRAQLRRERIDHAHELARLRAVKAPTVASALALAHVVYGVPVAGLSRLAWCESRHDPGARNPTPLGGSHATGLAQILYPSTWSTTPYAALSPFDAAASALAAGYIWRRAGGSFVEWADVCAVRGDG